MARLLKKHLGIGAKKSSSAPNPPKLDVETPPPPPPRPGAAKTDASETDSSSTVSSAATAGSNDEFPPPPGAWTLQQILGEATGGGGGGGGAQAFGGARPKDAKGQHHHQQQQHRPSENAPDRWNCVDSSSETAESDFVVLPKKSGKHSKDAEHIYENQAMFDAQHQIADSESLHEIKKWLGEINMGPSSADAIRCASSNDFRPKVACDAQLKADRMRSPRLEMSQNVAALVPEVASVRSSAVRSAETKPATGSSKPKESEYEKSNPATREHDYERYTRLREALKLELEQPLLSEVVEEEDAVCRSEPDGGFDPALHSDRNPMVRSDGYEEPWDLEAAQGEIEDRLNGVLVGEWILRENLGADAIAVGTQPVVSSPSEVSDGLSPHELDVRTQKGYERPWDWKPHMKDGRGEEGYERPWDWKPHMRDDRPPEEYEEPWDKKTKNVENEVIVAKIAKEAVRAARDGTAITAAIASQVKSADIRGQNGYDRPWDLKPHLKDSRPPDEYEEPWDKKAKDIESELIVAKIAKEVAKASAASGELLLERQSPSAVGLGVAAKQNVKAGRLLHLENEAVGNVQKVYPASKDGGKPATNADVSSPSQRHKRISPKKKTGLTPDLENSSRSRIGERILTRVPLEEQQWYHGTISRGDAEGILQGHLEGSFLVRHSESGTQEFSLSVKSTRGFMHMKIILDQDKKFILGQFSQPFKSIPQMIQYYTVSKLPIKGAEHMTLLYPVDHKQLS